MNFGHGNQPEYCWFYKGKDINKSPLLLENFRNKDIKITKIVDKWERAFILDSK